MAVVELGDKISFSPKTAKSVTIEWLQKGERSKEFRALLFTGVNRNDVAGVLFVESGLTSEFMAMTKKEKGDELSGSRTVVEVTKKMQYGQDRSDDPRIRFLVYHNTEDRIFQHRFVSTNSFETILKTAEQYVHYIPVLGPWIKKAIKLGKGVIGDDLRDF